MSLKPIQFILGQGGIGSPIPGADFISGYNIYTSSIPSGFVSGVTKSVFSLTQAESLGITNTYSDETAATGEVIIGHKGSTGDKITITVTEPGINGTSTVVTLCVYTQTSADTTNALFTASVAALINAGTPTHGYSATVGTGGSPATDTITITARKGTGISLNTGTPLARTVTGTITATLVQFSGGAYSQTAIWHYQVKEYFRMQPSGKLWITFNAIPGSYTFTDLNSAQVQANGEIRQFMIFSPNGTSTSNINADLDAIQSVCQTMFSNYTPASVIYCPNIFAISDLSTLTNTRLRSDNYVSCFIGQDGGGLGATLSLTSGISVPAMGACLGSVALAAVEQDIAWVGKFNVSNGSEDEVVAFANGTLWYNVTANLQTQIDSYGYIFLMKKQGITGSYFNDSHTAIALTSDYAYIERNRTIGKAQRIVYSAYTPLENSPLYLNQDGTLNISTINIFKDAVAPSLNQMVSNGEISAYNVVIDPTQNVQSTSTINITIQIVMVGVARNIVVTLGYIISI